MGFDRLRYVEIKHGRISMLAFLGNIDLSGDSFDSYPNGLAAFFGPDSIPTDGKLQMVFTVAFLELFVMKDVTGTGAFVGDFRNDMGMPGLPFGWDRFTDEEKLFKRGVELNNGRAAMCGILGLMVHEKLGGSLPIVGDMDVLRVWEPATGVTIL